MEERDKIKNLEIRIDNLPIHENPNSNYWILRQDIIGVKSPILRRSLYSKVDRVYSEYKSKQEAK